jgi:transcriptional regulator with XRE-family HTH domain
MNQTDLNGQMVKELRLRRGMTQEELATLICLSRVSITNIESGRTALLVHNLKRIFDALGFEAEIRIIDREKS